MSELTKALIQFHKDVDKIEKNARANYGKFADLANVLSTVTPGVAQEQPCHHARVSLKTASSPPSVT